MIESFFERCANGFKMIPGELPKNIPIMDLLKPEYKRTHYSWVSDGVSYSRKIDRADTCSICVTPDKKYLIVTQTSSKYGSDNLLVLNRDGTENRRLINPYRFSSEYQDGDQHEFLDVRNMGDKVLVKIAATRYIPSRARNAEPVYGTFVIVIHGNLRLWNLLVRVICSFAFQCRNAGIKSNIHIFSH